MKNQPWAQLCPIHSGGSWDPGECVDLILVEDTVHAEEFARKCSVSMALAEADVAVNLVEENEFEKFGKLLLQSPSFYPCLVEKYGLEHIVSAGMKFPRSCSRTHLSGFFMTDLQVAEALLRRTTADDIYSLILEEGGISQMYSYEWCRLSDGKKTSTVAIETNDCRGLDNLIPLTEISGNLRVWLVQNHLKDLRQFVFDSEHIVTPDWVTRALNQNNV